MKKYLLTIAIAISTCTVNASNSQAYQDTIKYLRNNILTHKAKFQQKPLDVLLNELGLVVKSYTLARGAKPGQLPKSIIIFFEDSNQIFSKMNNLKSYPFLVLSFNERLNNAWPLYLKNKGAWLDDEKKYFGKLHVKDIGGL